MVQTDPDAPMPGAIDTNAAEDLLEGAPALPSDDEPDTLDEQLLRAELKARMFGEDPAVRIGRYEVRARIGRGGMGTVYEARDPELDRRVALKLLRPDRRGGGERMLREARALARLTHPNVVTVHEVGTHDARVFLAMELIEGQTLREWLESAPSVRQVSDVFVQAARGLNAAHAAGLVHRDFKPDNVLIGDDGRVRVVDFGVVKPTDDGDGARPASDAALDRDTDHELTATGQLLGTPAYMAPEQFLGGPIDARTDVFAFCVVLYEALAGHRPFGGDDAHEVRDAVLRDEAKPLAGVDVSRALAALIARGLSRQREERPPSLDGFVELLSERAPRLPPHLRKALRVGVMVSSVSLLAGAALLWSKGEPPDEVPAAAIDTDPAVDVDASADIDAAFARIKAARDDQALRTRANAFLDVFGEQATDVRRAIAHSVVGDVLWRDSCTAVQGDLCVTERPPPAGVDRCRTVTRGSFEKHPRDKDLAAEARRHLEAAAALSGVNPQADDPDAALFAASTGRALVQLSDAELEDYLTLEVPEGLDFESASILSSAAFKAYFAQATKEAQALIVAYAKVKGSDAYWTVVAGARTGLLSEAMSEAILRASLPPLATGEQRSDYCEALTGFTKGPRKIAADAYRWVDEQATKHGVGDLPIVIEARERAATLERLIANEESP